MPADRGKAPEARVVAQGISGLSAPSPAWRSPLGQTLDRRRGERARPLAAPPLRPSAARRGPGPPRRAARLFVPGAAVGVKPVARPSKLVPSMPYRCRRTSIVCSVPCRHLATHRLVVRDDGSRKRGLFSRGRPFLPEELPSPREGEECLRSAAISEVRQSRRTATPRISRPDCLREAQGCMPVLDTRGIHRSDCPSAGQRCSRLPIFF